MKRHPELRSLHDLSLAISNEVSLPEGPDLWLATTELWFVRAQLAKAKIAASINQEHARRRVERATVPDKTASDGAVLVRHTPAVRPARWTVRSADAKAHNPTVWNRARSPRAVIRARAPKGTRDIGWPAELPRFAGPIGMRALERSMYAVRDLRARLRPQEAALKERMTLIANTTAQQAPHLWTGNYVKFPVDGWSIQTWQLTFSPEDFAELDPVAFNQLKVYIEAVQPESYLILRKPDDPDPEDEREGDWFDE